jgi:hypothetical protein
MSSKVRPIIAAACIAMTLALPAETQACWFWHRPAPVVAAAPVQQVNYVPQTCYRTVCSPVPVTSFRPITTTDPCTGCPVTSLSPVTTIVQRPVVVPYTTFRPVVTTVMMPIAPACPTCSACSACAAPTTSFFAPAAVAAPAPSCGCGAPALTATATAAPALAATTAPATSYYGGGASTAYYAGPTTATYPGSATSYLSGAPATTSYPNTTANYLSTAPATAGGSTITYYNSPSPPPATSGSATTTYYGSTAPSPGPVIFNTPASGSPVSTGQPTLPNNGAASGGGSTQVQKPADTNPPPVVPPQPIRDNKDSGKSTSSGIFQNDSNGRTTGMPMLRPWSYTSVYRPHITVVSQVTETAPAVDADGWHAAR